MCADCHRAEVTCRHCGAKYMVTRLAEKFRYWLCYAPTCRRMNVWK